jgi:hypothetical protein
MQMADGEARLVGTAFFLGREIEGTGRSFSYAVTAKHVIDGIRKKGIAKALIRVNLTGDESGWLETNVDDWLYHPTVENVDVAVLRTGFPERFDHLVCPISMAVTQEIISKEQIGLGTEVFLVGLFAHHFGKRKNIPIVRVGNISAMPEELVETRMGKIDAYLVEARSLGGLSGSPVFANLGVVRMHDGQLQMRTGDPFLYLLGLMHGHWDLRVSEIDDDVVDNTGIQRVNMGIGIVVPAQKIIEVINQPRIVQAEAEHEAELRRGVG